MKRQVITNVEDLDRLEGEVLRSVEATVALLKEVLASTDALGAFGKIKFTEAGRDPLDVTRPLNVVEQLNQTFTYLASVAGARWLLSRHSECAPLVLNLGTAPGFDIESKCGQFIAETSAVTHPGSNDKLRRDILKVQNGSGTYRFVFYLSPIAASQLQVPGVAVVRLEHPALTALSAQA
jgi:hypothetical protein